MDTQIQTIKGNIRTAVGKGHSSARCIMEGDYSAENIQTIIGTIATEFPEMSIHLQVWKPHFRINDPTTTYRTVLPAEAALHSVFYILVVWKAKNGVQAECPQETVRNHACL